MLWGIILNMLTEVGRPSHCACHHCHGGRSWTMWVEKVSWAQACGHSFFLSPLLSVHVTSCLQTLPQWLHHRDKLLPELWADINLLSLKWLPSGCFVTATGTKLGQSLVPLSHRPPHLSPKVFSLRQIRGIRRNEIPDSSFMAFWNGGIHQRSQQVLGRVRY